MCLGFGVPPSTFGRSDENRVFPFFALVCAIISTDELHFYSFDGEIKRPDACAVGEVQTNHFAFLGRERVVGLAIYEHGISEASHERAIRTVFVERRDFTILDQNVIQEDSNFAINLVPIHWTFRRDHEVPIESKLNSIVITIN